MKNYQVTLEVPDDFDPDKLDFDATYPEDIAVTGEGFFDMEDVLKSIDLENVKANQSNVVIFKYPEAIADQGPMFPDILRSYLESKLEGCTVIGMIKDIDILITNSVEATKMLQGMIDKINSKAIIKLK